MEYASLTFKCKCISNKTNFENVFLQWVLQNIHLVSVMGTCMSSNIHSSLLYQLSTYLYFIFFSWHKQLVMPILYNQSFFSIAPSFSSLSNSALNWFDAMKAIAFSFTWNFAFVVVHLPNSAEKKTSEKIFFNSFYKSSNALFELV